MKVTKRQFTLSIGAACVMPCRASVEPMAAVPGIDSVDYLMPELRSTARKLLQDASKEAPLSDATLAARRKAAEAAADPPLAGIPAYPLRVAGLPGEPIVEVWVVNANQAGARPAILHLHGGGHVLGNPRYELPYLQLLARDLDCVLVSVDYRLAPEVSYLGSTADTYAALRWLHASAHDLGIDPDRIALLGESAGGTHAALLALAARDRREIPIRFQSLIYPMLDDRTGSVRFPPPFIGAVLWGPAANAYGWHAFLGAKHGADAATGTAVPARAANLAGLPPTFVAVGGTDLFVDEDIEYARRLTYSGVPTELQVVPRAFHAFDRIAPETSIGKAFRANKIDALRRGFAN